MKLFIGPGKVIIFWGKVPKLTEEKFPPMFFLPFYFKLKMAILEEKKSIANHFILKVLCLGVFYIIIKSSDKVN